MARDTSKTEEETNGPKKVTATRIVTENELINFKLDSIIELLKSLIEPKENKVSD